ncbi:MAG: helicase C-terminal domain-containing protein [Candidatus Pacearchaeota archaeon]|jgi:Rad3-related DNA helicase|nr:DEAD/DEAH box helicase family protein [Clostridia bacterium]
MNQELEDKINEYIDMFVKNHGWTNFEFRTGQKEAIIDVVATCMGEEKKIYLIDAPTGSGKSLIALCSSYVLNRFGKKGYILSSDLALQDQYEQDVLKLHLGFGSVKGVDNYLCTENQEKHSLGECKMKHLNSNATKQLPCYKDCPYYFARDYASFTPTSIFNYSYYLIQMNYVLEKMTDSSHALFDERDFIICDEAHKVVNIVQKHFSPIVNDNTYPMLERLRGFLAEHSMAVPYSGYELKEIINKIVAEDDNAKLFIHNRMFEKMLHSFVQHADEIKKFVGRKYAGKSVPAEWRKGLNLCDECKDLHCKFEDYNQIIASTDIRAMIKNQNGANIQFNCINEKYLMKKHFHDKNNFAVMMTATMGEPTLFAKSINANNAKYRKIPSTFNFDRSPILIYQGVSMSFKNKEVALPKIANKITEILEKHKNENGIIHTGSYTNSVYLNENIKSDRIISYINSSDKKNVLFDFSSANNKVLMGPSLLEGLDLGNDKSRFQIFAKVPYPSLMDKFVNAKMKTDKDWYAWITILSVLQGVGRSVRNENDYATTYILDSDFFRLITQNRHMFPQDFLDRCVYVRF